MYPELTLRTCSEAMAEAPAEENGWPGWEEGSLAAAGSISTALGLRCKRAASNTACWEAKSSGERNSGGEETAAGPCSDPAVPLAAEWLPGSVSLAADADSAAAADSDFSPA